VEDGNVGGCLEMSGFVGHIGFSPPLSRRFSRLGESIGKASSMNWISWLSLCAVVSIEKSISPYTRVQRVKGLDVFGKNSRGIIFGGASQQGFANWAGIPSIG
jgi:hypothetical protein